MADSMIYAYIFYIAFAIFVIGFIYRVVKWANLPVPLKIVTTGGQGRFDNPKSSLDVILRMAGEVLVFRSLFRNTKYDLKTNTIKSNRVLWLGAIVFHISFLLIVLRHFRFFVDPVPSVITTLQGVDTITFLTPTLSFSGILIVIALLYLFIRRLVFPEMRYISILSDHLILLLLLAIVITGTLMRYSLRVDIIQVKQFMLGILTFSPISIDIPWILGLHLLLVSALLVYFPFSKLMHAPGIFFSPTRNQINNPRHVRHINPWNYPVKIQSFKEFKKEYENALKDVEE